MELHFVSPHLDELDALESEVLACAAWEDRRPPDGVAGLCDWRLAGRISALMRQGAFVGRLGEVTMIPGRPRLSFDKILLFGAGPRERFDEKRFLEVMHHMLDVIAGLRCRLAVVQLPGRQSDLVKAERATDMLLEVVMRDSRRRHDVWTLIEDAEARRRIELHMIEERRRIRRTE
ncbi:MAG: M17 family peptidase N-terminal domain-containing protein [Polyangiaceae bacterium]